jgi:hypothetical protein
VICSPDSQEDLGKLCLSAALWDQLFFGLDLMIVLEMQMLYFFFSKDLEHFRTSFTVAPQRHAHGGETDWTAA